MAFLQVSTLILDHSFVRGQVPAPQKGLGYSVSSFIQFIRISKLDDSPEVHHSHAIGNVPYYRQL